MSGDEIQNRFDELTLDVEEAQGVWQSATWDLENAMLAMDEANDEKAMAEAELQTFIDSLDDEEREAIQ